MAAGFSLFPLLFSLPGSIRRMAVGTSLAVIALNSTTGIVGQLRFVSFDWGLLAGFLVFALGGMVVGTTLANQLAEYRLRQLFACTVLVLAVAVGVGNLCLP